jgi:hypothetical protein
MSKRKRTNPRPILRRITIKLHGRTVKVHRQRITCRQATREIGHECLYTIGDAHTQRRQHGIVTCEITWTATESLLCSQAKLFPIDTPSAFKILRGGMIL